MDDDGGYGELIALAWREFVVAASYRGISSEVLIGLGDSPPLWFVEGECGHGLDQGPSLSTTFDRWRRTNARLLTEPEPARRKKPSANRPVAQELGELLVAVRRIVRTPHAERFARPPEVEDADGAEEAA